MRNRVGGRRYRSTKIVSHWDYVSFVVNVYMQIYLNLDATTMRITYAIGDERCILKLNRFVEHEPRHKIAIAITITTADHSKDDLLTAMFSLTLLEAFLFHSQPYCLFSFLFSLFPVLFSFFNVLCTENTSACCTGILRYLFVYEVHCTHTRWGTHENKQWKIAGSQKQFHLENFTKCYRFICLFTWFKFDVCVRVCMPIFVSVCVFWNQVASFLSLVNLLKSLILRSVGVCNMCAFVLNNLESKIIGRNSSMLHA